MRRTAAVAALLAAAVAFVAFPAFGRWGLPGSTPECDRLATLQVAAAPGLSEPVRRATSSLARVPSQGTCVRVVVTERASAEVASEVSRRAGQGLAAPLPDAWIPDSSLWLAVARRSDVGRSRIVGTPQSIARSPVVVALRRDRAEALGWPREQRGVAQLVDQEPPVTVAMTDPRQDTAGLATVLDVQGAGAAAAPAAGALSASLVSFARKVTVPLLGGRPPLQAVGDGTVDALPALERDVIAHNASAPGTLVALYGASAPRQADYPFVALSEGSTAVPALKRRAIDLTLAAVLGASAQADLAAAGFRGSSGKLDRRFGQAQGVVDVALPSTASPSEDQVRALIDGWSKLGRRGRVLVVVDQSGSMAGRLPGSTATKSTLASRALAAVVESVAPDSDMGLWGFTASKGTDYRELVPLGPVAKDLGGRSRREALRSAVSSIRPVRNGGTGLYDTTLSAFRAESKDFSYGRLNAILLITDGKNDDPGSISEGRLLDTLKLEFDGIRPVRIITVAYGADADLTTLRRIADVTGGSTYQAPTAQAVGPLFAKALGQL